MASSAVEQVVREELGHYPGVQLELKNGGKHDRAVFRLGDKSRFLTLPKTPSDHRVPMNIRRDLKRVLGELGVKRARQERKSRRHWTSDATLGLQASGLSLVISKHSKLHQHFETKDPNQAWSFELRSSVTLTDPPLLVVKRETIPEGRVRARAGMVRARHIRTGAFLIKMSRNALPAPLKRAPKFGAVELKLYADEGNALVFKLPEGVLPTSYQPHHDRTEEAPAPLPSQAWKEPTVEAPQEPRERTPEPRVPQVVVQPPPMPTTLQLALPKQTISIEQAIAVLNKKKQQLGNSLRFTVEEGGYLSAVHRIGK